MSSKLAQSNKVAKKSISEGTKLSSVIRKSKDGKEVRITVEEIKNGFLVTKSTEWHDKKTGYQYETEKIFSSENPLDFSENKALADAFNE